MSQNSKKLSHSKVESPLPILVDVTQYTSLELKFLRVLKEIEAMARQSERGYEVLFSTAFKSAELLDKIAFEKPEFAQKVASGQIHWPMLVSPSTKRFEELRVQIQKLGLGANLPLYVKAEKLLRTETPARNWIILALKTISDSQEVSRTYEAVSLAQTGKIPEKLLDQIEFPEGLVDWKDLALANNRAFFKACHALPDLNPNTVGDWLSVIKMYVMHNTSNHPERHPELKAIGQYKGCKGSSPRSIESNIRDGIFTQLKQTLKSLCKDK